MVYVMIWNPLERLLYCFAIFLGFYNTILFIIRAKNQENEGDKIIMQGIALAVGFLNIGQCFIFLSCFYFEGFIDNYIFLGDVFNRPYIYNFLNVLGNTISRAGILFMALKWEKVIKKTKFSVSIIILILMIIELIAFSFSMESYVSFAWIVGPITTIIFLLLFLWIVRKANQSLLVILSLLFVGYFLVWERILPIEK